MHNYFIFFIFISCGKSIYILATAKTNKKMHWNLFSNFQEKCASMLPVSRYFATVVAPLNFTIYMKERTFCFGKRETAFIDQIFYEFYGKHMTLIVSRVCHYLCSYILLQSFWKIILYFSRTENFFEILGDELLHIYRQKI